MCAVFAAGKRALPKVCVSLDARLYALMAAIVFGFWCAFIRAYYISARHASSARNVCERAVRFVRAQEIVGCSTGFAKAQALTFVWPE